MKQTLIRYTAIAFTLGCIAFVCVVAGPLVFAEGLSAFYAMTKAQTLAVMAGIVALGTWFLA